MSRPLAGSLLVAACGTTWGIIGVIVREIDAPAMTIVFFRVALAAVVLAVVLTAARRMDLLRAPSWIVLSLGVLLAVHWSFYFQAIKETSVASAVLVTYAAPIFMALLAPFVLRERVPPVSIVALGVSMAGIALIAFGGSSEGDAAVRPLGIALALVAAVTYGMLVVFTKRASAGVEAVSVVFWQTLVAGVVLAPAALLGDAVLDATDLAYLAVLGIVLTGFVNIFYVAALRWVPATTAGILSYMEPVSGAVLAAIILGEELTAPVIAGGLAIVAAGVAVVRAQGDEPLPTSIEQPAAVEPAAGRV